MKECKYCRSMYEDSLSACPNCGGNKVVSAEEKAEETKLHQKEIENRERAIAATEMQKKKLLGIVAGVVGVIIFIIAISSYNSNKPLSNGMSKDEGEAVLAKGIAYYESGDYESAIECFVQLPTDSEQYEEAQKMMKKSEDSYVSSALEKANGYINESQYEVALELLENAKTLFPENAELQKTYNDINATYKDLIRNNTIKEADSYANNNDYENAIKTLNSALDKIGQDEELVAKLNVCEDAYVTSVISAAKEQYVEYDYEHILAAKNLLETALSVVPDNDVLMRELDFYKKKLPVDILSLPITQVYGEDDFIKVGRVSDNRGVSYDNAIHLNYSAHVKVDYQYSKLTGKFFQSQKYANSPIEHQLVIYGSHDGKNWDTNSPLWSGKVSGNSNVLTIDVDTSKWKYIVIQYGYLDMDFEKHCYMADMYLWK